MTVRTAVLGYGVIGRRLADAVTRQDDMVVVGVAGPRGSRGLQHAARDGYATFATNGGAADGGGLADLVDDVDVVLDCSPSGVPAANLPVTSRKVVIFQGGEAADLAAVSFNAFANYGDAAGRRSVRVISCSSTGTTRCLFALDRAFGVKQAFVGLVRRATDPAKRSKLPVHALKPTLGQSHHGPDVRTVLPHLELYTMAVLTPTTLSHVLCFQVDVQRAPSRDEVLAAFDDLPRILVGTGLRSTAELADDAADRGRTRRDRPEIYVWEEGVDVVGETVHVSIAVHMESITIPETVDCVRAALGLERDPWASIERTDKALGIAKASRCYAHGGSA